MATHNLIILQLNSY